jgi:lysophospholipase L1-like esterase
MRRKVGFFAVGALLLASLATNAFLVHAARDYFKATLELRLDPAGLDVYAADRQKPAGDGSEPLLLLFGDSRAAMWATPPAPGYRIVNHGIGNQTTAQILMRLDDDVVRFHPSVVVLEAGVNDLKSIAEFPERRADIVRDCKANLTRIVAGCRSAGARVVLVTVFGIGNVSVWKQPFWSDDVAAAVNEVNVFLPTLAGSGSGVTMLDANQALDDESGRIRESYQLDYLHLSSSGYAALNGKLVPLVAALRP